MKNNKVLNAYIISGNGSRQQLNALSYNNGLLEYDGLNLYFTVGSTRKPVQLITSMIG